MEKFTRLVHAENGLVNAETLTQVKGGFARVNSDLRKLSRQLDETKLRDDDITIQEKIRKKLKLVLRPCSSSEDRYNTMRRGRVPQNGDWLREESEFVDWIDGSKSVLWISGNPGAGKSYLATNVVTYLEEMPDVSRGFFFFKDDDPITRSAHQALRDIAFQIAQSDPLYASYVCSCIDSPEDIPTLQSLWRNLFLDVFVTKAKDTNPTMKRASDRPVHLVFDALDETFAEDRAELFELMKDLQGCDERIRILLLGRPQIADEMHGLMNTLEVPTIHISEGNNFEDIVQYIKLTIADSFYLKRLPAAVKRQIVQKLSTDSQGMFLWVSLMVQELSRIRNKGEVERKLGDAPKGLSKMISHVLRGFSESLADNPQFADDFNELVAWMVCAPQPLTLGQVENILKLKSSDGESWIWLEGSLRVQFASIFVLNREDGLSTADLKRMAIRKIDTKVAEPGEGDYDSDDSGHLDATENFDSDLQTTTISFSHASLAEFFRGQGGKVVAGPDCPQVGIEYLEARLLVLKRCFEVARNPKKPRVQAAVSLQEFVCDSLVSILDTININSLTDSQQQFIGSELAQFLTQKSTFENILRPYRDSFFNESSLKAFNSFLELQNVQNTLPDETKLWLQDALSKHPAEILRPMADDIAKSRMAVEELREIPGWFLLLRDFKHLRYPECSPNLCNDILELAEWGQHDHDAFWHERVGLAFYTCSIRHDSYELLDNSIEYLCKAIDMMPNHLPFRHNLGVAYQRRGDQNLNNSDIEQAIDAYKFSIQEHQKEQKTEKMIDAMHREYESLAECYSKLQDKESALQASLMAQSWDKRCTKCIEKILIGYHTAGRVNEMAHFFQNLHTSWNHEEPSPLVELLIKDPTLEYFIQTGLNEAIIRNGYFPAVAQAFTEAASIAHCRKKPIIAAKQKLTLAFLQGSHGGDLDGASKICEQVLQTYNPNQASNVINELEMARLILSDYYVRQCSRACCSNAERNRYGKMLEDIVLNSSSSAKKRTNTSVAGGYDSFKIGFHLRLILAVYYQICGRGQDALQHFKPLLEETAYNVNEDSDMGGLSEALDLAKVLMSMHDLTNTTAVMYHAEYLVAEHTFGGYTFGGYTPCAFCDGCGMKHSMDGLVFRSYCQMSQGYCLCQTCFSRLKSGDLSLKFWDATDDFMDIPPRPREVRERTEEHRSKLYLDGKWITIRDFQLHLKEQYGLSEIPPPRQTVQS